MEQKFYPSIIGPPIGDDPLIPGTYCFSGCQDWDCDSCYSPELTYHSINFDYECFHDCSDFG